jgi:catechol 2,3-dioxygenase-like lactoylglutathione lyase family enzyme
MGHVAIHVKDVDRAVAFYKDVLGLNGNWIGDQDWANVNVGHDDLSLVRKEGHRHPPHLGFRVASREDLEQAHRELSEGGYEPDDIHTHRDKTVSFYFTDPDGNILEALWDPRENK